MDGRRNEALTILEELLKRAEEKGSRGNYEAIAMLSGALGQHDRAFDYLERMYERRSAGLPMLKVSPFYDPLRNDPRFDELLRRIGL
jgi:hypothetical protein